MLVRDLEIIAEDLVEADLQRGDAGPFALASLQGGQEAAGVAGQRPGLVEFDVHALADDARALDLGRGLVGQRVQKTDAQGRQIGHAAGPVGGGMPLVIGVGDQVAQRGHGHQRQAQLAGLGRSQPTGGGPRRPAFEVADPGQPGPGLAPPLAVVEGAGDRGVPLPQALEIVEGLGETPFEQASSGGRHRPVDMVDQGALAAVAAEGAEDLEVAQGLLVQQQAVAARGEGKGRDLDRPGEAQGRDVAQQGPGGGHSPVVLALGQAEGVEAAHAEMVAQGAGGEGRMEPGGADPVDHDPGQGGAPGVQVALAGGLGHDDLAHRVALAEPGQGDVLLAAAEVAGGSIHQGPAVVLGLAVDGEPGQAVVARGAGDQSRRRGGARADHLDHLAADQPLGLGGILDLFADGHGQAGREQASQIGVQGVIGHAGQGDRMLAVLVPGRQGDVGDAGQDLGVLEEGLVEVAHAEEQQGAGVLALDLEVLRQHRGQFGGRLARRGHGRSVVSTSMTRRPCSRRSLSAWTSAWLRVTKLPLRIL